MERLSAAFRLAATPAWSGWRRLAFNGFAVLALATLSPGAWLTDDLAGQVFIDTAAFSCGATIVLASCLVRPRTTRLARPEQRHKRLRRQI